MKQPLTCNDFTPDSLLRRNGQGFIKIAEVDGVGVKGMFIGRYSFKDLANGEFWTIGLESNYPMKCKWEVSHDNGKTWGPCYKEITVT